MNIYQIICSIITIAITITHLVFVRKNNKLAIQITKGLINCFLFAYALVSTKTINEDNCCLYLGLAFSLIGNLLLLLKQKKSFFISGTICFALTFIFYFIITTKILPSSFNWCYYGIVFLVGYLVVEFIRKILKKMCGKLTIPYSIYIYLSCLISINLMCGTLFNFNILTLIMLVGSIFLIISNVMLIKSYFVKTSNKRDFKITLFYYLSEILIVLLIVLIN